MVTAFSLPVSAQSSAASGLVELDGTRLTIDEVVQVARSGARAVLAPGADEAIARGELALRAHVAAGATIYGLTTGVGALDGHVLSPLPGAENRAFQRHLLLSHAAGTGAPLSLECVRAMLLARANVLARGRSGVRLPVVRALLALIDGHVYPYVPEVGSVGASDLAALAHAALVLIGEGWAMVDGARVHGSVAMKAHGLALAELSGRDALALINGPAQTLGTAALVVHDAMRLGRMAEIAAALSMIGARSRTDFLEARLFEDIADESAESARRLRTLLAPDDCAFVAAPAFAVREPLSTRCAPMVFGAFHAAVARAHRVVSTELNRPVDNPVLLSDGALTNDSGLMHSARVAEALDAMVTSIGNLAQMSERRLYRLLDPHVNGGLPAFLVHPLAKSGLNSGFMIHQYTAAALVGELRAACVPASAQSIPVGNGTEDHGAMSTLAARRAARAVSLAETVVAIELLGAVQAIDVRRTVDEGPSIPAALRGAWRGLRSRVPVLVEDRLAAADIEAAVEYVRASGSGAEGEADLWEQHEL